MTKCEYYQNKACLLRKVMMKTKGTMREIWKKHLEEIIEKVNNMTVQELQERV